jgi:hypothetical protein
MGLAKRCREDVSGDHQAWCARMPQFVRIPARFERTHLDAKGRDFLGKRLGESSHSPLGSVVRRAAGKGQATDHLATISAGCSHFFAFA